MVNYNYYCLNKSCENKKLNVIPKESVDSDNQFDETCHSCGELMKRVGRSLNTLVKGSSSEEYTKTITHIKDRAKKHNATEETQYQRRVTANKEINNYRNAGNK